MGALAVLALGCGGRVVVDGPGGTGSGQGGSGGGGGPTDPDTVCAALCEAEMQLNCPKEVGAGDCEAGCKSNFESIPQCAAQLAALLDCATSSLLQSGDCTGAKGPSCDAEANSLTACIMPSPGP